MSRQVAKPPIIVIRKRVIAAGHHGGAWKVAYADFVTAMMALFIVLWLLSSSQEVQKVVGGYFNDPKGEGKMVGTTRSGIGDSLSVGREDLERLKERISQAIAQLPNVNNLKGQVSITITPEGLRIELLESLTGLFFELGSPRPTQNGHEVLLALGKQLAAIPNPVVIEGHTDSKPYGQRSNYSNWELSSDRANSARRVLVDGGLSAQQVSQVRGFADQRLRDKTEPEDPSNRRVSVIVKFAPPSSPAPHDNVGS